MVDFTTLVVVYGVYALGVALLGTVVGFWLLDILAEN